MNNRLSTVPIWLQEDLIRRSIEGPCDIVKYIQVFPQHLHFIIQLAVNKIVLHQYVDLKKFGHIISTINVCFSKSIGWNKLGSILTALPVLKLLTIQCSLWNSSSLSCLQTAEKSFFLFENIAPTIKKICFHGHNISSFFILGLCAAIFNKQHSLTALSLNFKNINADSLAQDDIDRCEERWKGTCADIFDVEKNNIGIHFNQPLNDDLRYVKKKGCISDTQMWLRSLLQNSPSGMDLLRSIDQK